MNGKNILLKNSKTTIVNLNLLKMRSFKKYNEENPQIYIEFKRLAYQLINRGYKHIGAKQIFEVIRWNTMISGNDGFKVNNTYTSDYARLFEKDHPIYAGIFRKRLCRLKED